MQTGLASRGSEVAAQLRSDIIAGVFAQGDRLTEEQLCARYTVSRVPVREALRFLQAEGFVTIQPYKNTRVAWLGPTEALDLMRVRQALEEVALRRAAERRSWQAVSHFAEILAAGKQARERHDLARLTELNAELHASLVEASGSPSLSALYRQIRFKIQWVHAQSGEERTADWPEHDAIVAAVVAGDGKRAAHLAAAHVEAAAEHYQRQICRLTSSQPASPLRPATGGLGNA